MTFDDVLTLLAAASITLGLSVAGIALGLPIGLGLALLRSARLPVLDQAIAALVSLVRAAPIVTLALFVFFVLPEAGLELAPIPAAVVTLTLNTAAFDCEIFRAGLAAFPRDQLEAASAYGLRPATRFRRIVLPQLWRASLGPLVSEMTIVLKGTPAVAVIGVVEITRAAGRIGAQTYEPLPPFLAATVLYTALIAVLVRGQRFAEARIARRYGYAVS
ncbi:amino acid ABC transporter permease [Methylobacterium sp. J-070]|uniref:amino acid ABC transporter permease n=1 Tax=Methylobacterium sp. J-070 TaxID=2836650 RepID=UPI001FB97517|nr:amino acid ABC transporter permease [Methylobacterium sp. J-070]MCJ2048842.1 amino acid ABC transporter permease [Methylobacterium sp. J-070]